MSSDKAAVATNAHPEGDATQMISGLVSDLTFARERAARAEANHGDLEREFELVRRQRIALVAELEKIKKAKAEQGGDEPLDIQSKLAAAQKRRAKPRRAKPVAPDISLEVAPKETPNPA
jgi:hypothetical protein